MLRQSKSAAIIGIGLFLLLGFWQISNVISAQEKPLTLAEVLTGLQSRSSGMSIRQKNQYITQRVRQRGVSFSLTPEIETELRQAGATDELIETVRSNRKSSAAPIPKPTPSNSSDEQKSSNSYTEILPGNVQLEMVYIQPGKFKRAIDPYSSEPLQEVTISRGFYIGKYEITQEQWKAVMGNNPSFFKNCPRCPVDSVSWNNAKEFIKKLNARSKNYEYRLPSDAEWEYAARAGTTTKYAFGDTLNSDQANFNPKFYDKNAEGAYKARTTPVGSYPPNAWGLYDTHGNVYEWCEDFYVEKNDQVPTDGSPLLVKKDENQRVLRGGSWYAIPDHCTSALRVRMPPAYRSGHDIGFRLAATAK